MIYLYIGLGYLGLAGLLSLIGVLAVNRWLKSLPQKTTGYVERTDDEIIAAWEKWLERSSSPDEKYSYCHSRLLSDREFVQAMKDGDKEILDFAVINSRKLAKLIDTDPVKEILSSRP